MTKRDISSPDHQPIYQGNHVTAVLGPTNTGKTHLAIERMVAHETGIIGLPLRLLAREVYDRLIQKVPATQVALITGEEKIKPEKPRYWVATVEAMPRNLEVEFVAIDEAQLAMDPERGHVFTNRLLHLRGTKETLLLGSETIAPILRDLLAGVNFITRPRLSKLSYAGEKKISRLARRSAIVAFSANDVYSIAELVRRQRGGAAVVMGALSPRTRNAQVALYQNGDVDFLVATDAIGMGLNLDIDHVAFAGSRKFDGRNFRELTPEEFGQIAGRAGRHMNDGTFGVTGTVAPFDPNLVEQLESHSFRPAKLLQWRNRDLDFSSLERLWGSLLISPKHPRLVRAPMAEDMLAFETLSRDKEVQDDCAHTDNLKRLWSVCQLPDYRKISPNAHAEFISKIYHFLAKGQGYVPEDWLDSEIGKSARFDGNIDTLANRIAHIRSWTFIANQADWVKDPEHWQGRTKKIEEQLSDALHERLTQRFIDTRTSTLVRSLADGEELFAEIGEAGAILVEGHCVGHLKGFSFSPISRAGTLQGKAARSAAYKILLKQLHERSNEFFEAPLDTIELSLKGDILWQESKIAYLSHSSDKLAPQINLIADERLDAPDQERIKAKLNTWFSQYCANKIGPLLSLKNDESLTGLAKGVGFQIVENLGVLVREQVRNDIKQLDQEARGLLRRHGVRFGAFNIYIPILLKPAASSLLQTLWAVHNRKDLQDPEAKTVYEAPKAGITSLKLTTKMPADFLKSCGYHLCGDHAIRIDILERLSEQIRPLISARKAQESKTDEKLEASKADKAKGGEPLPTGATGDGGFYIQPDMMAILGCTPADLCAVLKHLGFHYAIDQDIAAKLAAQAKPDTPAKSEEESSKASAEIKENEPDYRSFVWRAKKRPNAGRKKTHGAHNHPKDQHGAKKQSRTHSRGKKPAYKQTKPKKDRPMDPDSPFAQLQGLKDQLDAKAKGK